LGAIVTTLGLVLAACGTQSSVQPSASGGASGAPSEPGEVVEIEWYVGLGTGENEEQIPIEQEAVDAFNAEHPNIRLEMTVVDNTEAEESLATRIASGDAPDIIGPVGIRGLQTFGENLLDLTPYLGNVDLSEVEPSLIEAFNVDGKQIGLPTGVYPSFFYYNKTLFDEAELPYPPHEVGEQYEGEDWTWDTVRDLAMRLTVDANGEDATSPDFDPETIEQWGLDAQFTENDARAWSTVFGGSGSIVGDDGTTAQWPDNWRDGLEFMYDGIWTDHFIPSKAHSDGFGTGGNNFQTGKIAMDVIHLWYVCCIYPGPPEEGATAPPAPVTDWDIAVLPEGPDGEITAKLHADTIGLLDTTEHPEEAFEALTWIASNPDLVTLWGAMPARESQRDDFFAALDERFPDQDVDWNVATQMLEFPDVPSHEGAMPNFLEAYNANKDLGNKLWTTPGLNVQDEIDAHLETLQAIFDEAD
jgi:multiple sugar transport system substrate-binding protein